MSDLDTLRDIVPGSRPLNQGKIHLEMNLPAGVTRDPMSGGLFFSPAFFEAVYAFMHDNGRSPSMVMKEYLNHVQSGLSANRAGGRFMQWLKINHATEVSEYTEPKLNPLSDVLR